LSQNETLAIFAGPATLTVRRSLSPAASAFGASALALVMVMLKMREDQAAGAANGSSSRKSRLK